ncbi:MAG: multi-sensor hybrid histidine kinase [Actinobacteria bacterium]|nr:multi-sensor hybrid histidine kinase [Actinomycetota bacterium]
MLRRMIAGKQVPWLVLVVSLTATIAVWLHTRTDVLEEAGIRFHARAEEYKGAIIERMRDYKMVLRGGVGLFDASEEVSRDSWRAYIQAQQIDRHFPGTQGVGFSKRIHPQEKASHVRQVRAEGFPGYSIRPEGEHSEYTSIIFLEPFSGRNLRAFGYDMFSEAVRRAAMEQARDEGIPTLSGKVILVQETDKEKQNGVLMYVPVYRRGMPIGNVEERRAALTGYVYSPLRLNDLMEGILGKAVAEADIVLYDGKEKTAGNFLYANGAEKTAAKERGKFRSAFTDTLTFDLYGKTWTIRIGSLPPFEATIETGKPLYVLSGGVGISLLLFGVTFGLALRYKVLAKIEEAEEALREANIQLEIRVLERTAELSKTNESLRQEIVRRKQVEEELRGSEAELTEAQRVGGVGNWSLDPKTGEVTWSKGLFRIFGRDPGLPPPNYEEHTEILPPESLEKANAAIERCLQRGEPYELDLEFFRPDGARGWIIAHGEARRDENGRIVGLRGTVFDNTVKKKTEEQLRKILSWESALRKTNEKILSGIDFKEVFEIACDAIMEMGYRMCWIGLAEPDQTVRPIASRGFDEGYLETIRVRWDESPEGRGPTGIAIRTGRLYVMQDLQGENLYAPWREAALQRGYHSSAAIPLKLSEEDLIGCLTIYSERKDAFGPEEVHNLETFGQQCTIALMSARRLEELRDTTRRLAFHIEQLPMGYIVWDGEFRVLEWNPAAERIFGWKANEAIGKNAYELIIAKEARPRFERGWSKLLKGDESSYSLNANIRKDGKIITCEWFNALLRDASGNVSGVLSMVHDVTEKTELEKQLRVSQKMESVGTLAGGIAHDFNNSLTGIIGFGELLRMRMAGDEQALHDLDEILRCAERAATLTRQLLTFARRQFMEPVNLNVSTLVADLMKLIGKVVGEHIEVKTSLENNIPTIHVDRGQIEQVVMNLCLNSRDAMPEGGRLTVETEDVVLEEEYVRHNAYMRTGRYALLTVSDTGVGMDEKTRERVFDPFFTTKRPDKGTGLGLAMVYGIVKQHGGFIHLYSEPGKGTAFKVYFPAIEAQPDAVPEKRREEILRGGMETILLAEDEEAIRALVERTLKELGYTVLVASNGEEAIELFRQNKEIALAVLDVVMPRKGGMEAFKEMHKANPNLKVIFMSGYAINAIHDSFVLIAGMPFLQKPFGPTILARKIREVLDTQ